MACLVAILLLAACDTAVSTDEPERPTEITLLVVYTPGVRTATDVEETVRHGVEETNAVYQNSGVNARLVPVHVAEVDYAVTDVLGDLERLLHPDDGVLDDVHRLRNEHAADLVLLVTEVPGATISASVMATPSTAFVMVHWEALGAPSYALAHEVGHLHGARHALADDPALEPFPYGHGFRNDSLRTLMVSSGAQRKIPVFSGPGQRYNGVALGDSARQDVARVLRETAVYLSNFRGPQTPTDFVPPGTWPTLPGRF